MIRIVKRKFNGGNMDGKECFVDSQIIKYKYLNESYELLNGEFHLIKLVM